MKIVWLLLGLGMLAFLVLSGWWVLRLQESEDGPGPQLVVKMDDTTPQESLVEEVVLEGLRIPWDLGVVSESEFLVTTRAGVLLWISENQVREISVLGVEHVGEGGLLGVVVDKDFDVNRWVYLYLTYRDGGRIYNKVSRFELTDASLENEVILLDEIPGASNHNGGKIAWGPDDKLYVTTGDASRSELAQDVNSYAGKILRLNADGSVPEDNPFGNPVWAMGLRNSQGLAWDDRGQLYATDHGPSGINTGYDELNLIVKGGNYGWPVVYGDESREGMIDPLVQSGGSETWAPAGVVYWDGSVWFAGLRGESIYEVRVNEDVELVRHLQGVYGRLRSLVREEDGWIYVTTSNRDGRGTPRTGDDRVIRINLGELR